MMGEIVDDGNAVYFAANFTATANALERRHCVDDCLTLNAPRIRGNDHGQTVAHIELAYQRSLKLAPLFSFTQNSKTRHPSGTINVACLPSRVFTGTESFDLSKQSLAHRRDYFAHQRTVPARDQTSVAGDGIHKAAKGEFHCVDVFVNVRVIEFNITDDGQL